MTDDTYFLSRQGETDEYSPDMERRQHVRFPVCLAVLYENTVVGGDADFVLNLSRGGVFIATSSPGPVGARVVMHFYIPPENKLLGEFEGEIIYINPDNPAYPKGMHIKFVNCSAEALARLESFLEEKEHLVDKFV